MLEFHTNNENKITRAKIKTVKMTVVIISNYMICWTPYFVIQMMSAWGYRPPELTDSLRNYFVKMTFCVCVVT